MLTAPKSKSWRSQQSASKPAVCIKVKKLAQSAVCVKVKSWRSQQSASKPKSAVCVKVKKLAQSAVCVKAKVSSLRQSQKAGAVSSLRQTKHYMVLYETVQVVALKTKGLLTFQALPLSQASLSRQQAFVASWASDAVTRVLLAC